MFKKLMILLFCSSLLSGCSLFSKKPIVTKSNIPPRQNEEARKLFERANTFLDAEDYKSAVKYFKKLLGQYPSSNFELLALYNLGTAYEALNLCGSAVNRYRRILRTSSGKFPRLEAKAMFRLSYAYECLGRDDKVVASLLDLRKRASQLEEAEAVAELPARLAAAYSRLGNDVSAKKFFVEAGEGLKRINEKIRNPEKKKEILSKTLYFMGDMKRHQIEKMGGESYIKGLKELQLYSLKSAELDDPTWSPKSAGQIVESYDLVWIYLQNLNKLEVKKKSVFDQASWQKKQESLAVLTLDSLRYLKHNRFPDEKEAGVVKKLFFIIDEQEKRLVDFLSQTPVLTRSTPEAESREGLKRMGRVYKPNPALEEKREKESKLPSKEVQ